MTGRCESASVPVRPGRWVERTRIFHPTLMNIVHKRGRSSGIGVAKKLAMRSCTSHHTPSHVMLVRVRKVGGAWIG